MAYYRANIGGGGGGFPYTKSGTLPDFTANNQEQTVDTGLSEVKYFYVEGTYINTATLARVWVDKDKAFSKQVSTYGTASGINVAQSGNDANGVITGNSVYLKVSAFSGGTVTVKTGNTSSYWHKNVKWYAG